MCELRSTNPRFRDSRSVPPRTPRFAGRADQQVPLTFVRVEPLVVPKRSLSGGVSERVDTRVLELIYSVSPNDLHATVGQQVDVFIEEL